MALTSCRAALVFLGDAGVTLLTCFLGRIFRVVLTGSDSHWQESGTCLADFGSFAAVWHSASADSPCFPWCQSLHKFQGAQWFGVDRAETDTLWISEGGHKTIISPPLRGSGLPSLKETVSSFE